MVASYGKIEISGFAKMERIGNTDTHTGISDYCAFNRHLKCPVKNGTCPFQDPGFTRDLEFFLYTNRTPRSPPLEPSKRGCFAHDEDIFKALKAMVFGDDFIQDYDILQKTGKIAMTYRLCRQWREVKAKWNRLLNFPRNQ
jgi:hypothetical protein